ncbi:hypothetical protein Tco_1251636 [Tanacetum coccineum]
MSKKEYEHRKTEEILNKHLWSHEEVDPWKKRREKYLLLKLECSGKQLELHAEKKKRCSGGIRRGIVSLESPEKRRNLETSANIARAELGKGSGETDMSKDTSGPESLEGLQRSWYVERQIRSGVISFVLAQQY